MSRERLDAINELRALSGHPGWHRLRDDLRGRQDATMVRLTASGGTEQTKTELAAEWRTLHYVLDGAIPRLIEELGGTSGD